jgi:hypothetical protein
MTPVALGALASASPVPAGSPRKHAVDAGGGIAFPPDGNWINLSGGIAQLGPFNRPYRFWLRCGCNDIFASATSWTRYDTQIILLKGGVGYVADLNGQTFHQNADSEEATAGWCGSSIEATFYCEANIDWYVRWLTKNSPGGVQYYQHPTHTNMWAYTVGEGVY